MLIKAKYFFFICFLIGGKLLYNVVFLSAVQQHKSATIIQGGDIYTRKAWQPAPVFLPGESHGQRSLVGYSRWGCKDSNMIEAT